MSPFEQLKDKLAYFGGYKWLPYVDAVELVNEMNEQEKAIKKLLEFARDCHVNWDCDIDAHKYNTLCRACEAEKLIAKFTKVK